MYFALERNQQIFGSFFRRFSFWLQKKRFALKIDEEFQIAKVL
jgi:hypothetical protein